MYNPKVRRVHATIVAVERQYYIFHLIENGTIFGRKLLNNFCPKHFPF